jgi:hypothetical protein
MLKSKKILVFRNLQVSGYIRSPSKGNNFNAEELEVFAMLRRAVLIALRHTRYNAPMRVQVKNKRRPIKVFAMLR